MDCEKFDQILIDALYDELDELTLAAAKRHAEGCPRCQAAWSGLKATRKIGILPLVDAPVGLDSRILQAAREAQRNVPWPKRLGRGISWAGSYAMRPQTAMAAILLLMLGSSVIFVRVKPDRSGAPSRVSVTERGIPEQAAEELHPDKMSEFEAKAGAVGRSARRDEERGGPASPPPTAVAARDTASDNEPRGARALDKAADPFAEAPVRSKGGAPAAAPAGALGGSPSEGEKSSEKKDELANAAEVPMAAAAAPSSVSGAGASALAKDAYAAAMDLYAAGRYAEAEKSFADLAATGSKNAPSAALYSAKSTEAAYGCGRAAPRYESAASRFSGSTPGAEAMWGAANCYKATGNVEKARQLYIALRSVAGYRDRAEGELENLKLAQQQSTNKGNKAPAKASAPASKAAPLPAQ